MGVGINLKLGQLVPICHTLTDGNSSLYVQAKVYNQSNVLLATINLTNAGSGIYTHNAYYMPVATFIRIQFSIYSDDLYTVLNINYTLDHDIFYTDTSTEYVGFELVGVVEADDLIGEVIDDSEGDLIGTIEDDSLTGVVEDDSENLNGIIDEDSLTGIIEP
jgi:hypothetical protein